jgi:hypothetical protein
MRWQWKKFMRGILRGAKLQDASPDVVKYRKYWHHTHISVQRGRLGKFSTDHEIQRVFAIYLAFTLSSEQRKLLKEVLEEGCTMMVNYQKGEAFPVVFVYVKYGAGQPNLAFMRQLSRQFHDQLEFQLSSLDMRDVQILVQAAV